ncbi:uncharacterized protein PHALS_07963 [Plasmopara halstedii]|uniref:Uncharacterized protein n=1 Tax=Plasmopara halstedii TaxID=4781 RepID=A0A0P1B5Y0_PLAHL|nr:uncharacterized protein PHALS_07963 [Plasmopara halstedii]CEG50239.1 hypothetical protein PHALS_07963 [Plasmopara halstedii]|eukprot:XP_024586608.1 hypothetical protein PHALS_07963 [Plasmopara halstedii]
MICLVFIHSHSTFHFHIQIGQEGQYWSVDATLQSCHEARGSITRAICYVRLTFLNDRFMVEPKVLAMGSGRNLSYLPTPGLASKDES